MERNNGRLHITSWYLVLPDTSTLLCITHTLSFSLSNSVSDSASVHHYHCLCLCLVSVCVSVSSSVPVPFPIAITVSVSVSVSITLFVSFTARTPRQPTFTAPPVLAAAPEEHPASLPTESQLLHRQPASETRTWQRPPKSGRRHRSPETERMCRCLAHTLQRPRMHTAKL